MKNEETAKYGKVKARGMICIVVITMTISMLFSTPGIAVDDGNNTTMESVMKSNLFFKLIGSTVSALKVEGNKDDTSFVGRFSINALNIVNNEISFLTVGDFLLESTDTNEHANVVQNIVINPFKINDGSISMAPDPVSIVGDPSSNLRKRILIYHTHTNEAYAEGNSGLESTVAGVGDVLASELEKLGFTVIHDKTVHDVADYNNAYYASRDTVNKYLSSYGDFDLIIDLHRDGGPAKPSVTGTIDGNNIARLSLVTTKRDPRYEAHITKMQEIVDTANDLYPGLFKDGERGLIAYNHGGITFYNQDLSDNAILMEVGADVNNLQEAKNSMVYMSKVIGGYLNSK